ncbi:glycosyltransferase family 8 protein [Parabacteroides goldsteinii]|uniref:glycosyltransferase family 8 protein n=1 Tax=Parabacteroides goldsteinii TaxID=328812 RepID=UPI002165ED09|nr:glycosyltransferase family 8 protein [Parabacteroides goldsteinii]MCS2426460.1 glycosyltransferase family 8 protein [Parabacteroides goldsteinii]
MIHIACCTDDAYTEPCGILMISICENKGNESIHFHILTNTILSSNEKILRDIAKRYGQVISIYKVNENNLKNCPIQKNDRVSIVAYFRILLPVILPESIRKILYLDCDILVLKELDHLWNTNIEHHSAGVVMDQQDSDIRKFNNLEYEMTLGYFNSGVMLINLDYWRINNITTEVLEYINNNPEKLKLWDQDALNYVLKETKLNLPLCFNVQDGFYWKDPFVARKYWKEMYEATENPVILHFCCAIKPWHKESSHPKRLLYSKYKSLSPWKDKKIGHVNLKRRIKIVITNLLIKLGFKTNSSLYRDLKMNM